MGKLVSIQHLRGLAVFSVVVFHALQWEWIPFEPGQFGVELFFIISGFVMWFTTAGRETAPLAFMARRAARVVPLYWLASLTALTVVLIRPGAIPNVIPERLQKDTKKTPKWSQKTTRRSQIDDPKITQKEPIRHT